MLFIKKIASTLVCLSAVICFGASDSFATQYDVNIIISNLEETNLAAFDMDISYDSSLLTFLGYTLTDELGSFTGPDPDYPDAEDWSLGDDGDGTVNIAVLSCLSDFDTQSDDFTIVTLTFFADDVSALSTIALSPIYLVDDNEEFLSSDCLSISVEPVPEPCTIALMSIGLTGLAGFARRKRK